MKKSTLFKKGTLIIIFILILALFTGCTVFLIPNTGQTGTVHINIANEDWYYDIYLDSYSNYLGTTDVYGQKIDDTGLYSGQKTQYIHSGINFVDIYVYYNY